MLTFAVGVAVKTDSEVWLQRPVLAGLCQTRLPRICGSRLSSLSQEAVQTQIRFLYTPR